MIKNILKNWLINKKLNIKANQGFHVDGYMMLSRPIKLGQKAGGKFYPKIDKQITNMFYLVTHRKTK